MRLKTKTIYMDLDGLAAKVGRTKDLVRRVLKRQRRPSPELAARLVACGISPRRFLAPTEDKSGRK